jgi:hypothetical protein
MPLVFQAFQMKLDCFANQFQNFLACFSGSHAAGKVRDICPEAGGAFFDNDHVAHDDYFNPACFSTLFNVLAGKSMLFLPATVTVPGLAG